MNEFMKNSYNLENLRKQRACHKNTKNLTYGDSTLTDCPRSFQGSNVFETRLSDF